MKQSRSSYEALSPHSAEYRAQDYSTEQYSASTAQASVYAECFEDALGSTEDLNFLQQYLGSLAEPNPQANTSNQSGVVSTSVDTQRNRSQVQQVFGSAEQSPLQYNDGVLRGVTNLVRHRGPVRASCENRSAHQHFMNPAVASPYNTRHISYSVTSQRSTVTPMPNLPAALTESSEVRLTPYAPYRGLFLDSNAARDHRHLSTRFGRQPYIDPEDDSSIAEVESNRSYQVGRIYKAMIRGDRAQDNPGSIALKRWVECAHYKPDLVEAFAHKVFDCLLVQVKEGFRGWHHNDYVEDDRKGEREDREGTCMDRLENMIDALEREKTICEDVVNSACQIRMFVNAPIAYAARKHQNRIGNSKRGRTKGTSDFKPRPTKARRIGGRQTRTQPTTVSEAPASRDTTPQFHSSESSALPYYETATSQQTPSSPTPAYLNPRQPLRRLAISTTQVPTGCRKPTTTARPVMTKPIMSTSALSRSAMSPPTLLGSRSYNKNVTTMPSTQISPLLSTPSLSYSYHSAPPSPDDQKYPVAADSPNSWPNTDPFDNSLCTPVDPSLDLLYPQQVWADNLAPAPTRDSADHEHNQVTSHISPEGVEYVSPQALDGSLGEIVDFESLWNAQPGVQPFSFEGRLNYDLGQH